MTTVGLTRGQLDTVRIVQELTAENGFSPSYEEIKRELGVASRGNVVRMVEALVERGYLARRPGHARTLQVLRAVPLPEDLEFVGTFDAPGVRL